MKIVCAWCKKTMRDDPASDAAVSHGICVDCMRQVVGGNDKDMKEFLGTVGVPVIVLDSHFNVVDLNGRAEKTLGQEVAVAKGTSVGLAISCHSASEPGGCGPANWRTTP